MSNEVSIVKNVATLGDKSYSPNPITVETGNTVMWNNMDNIYILLRLVYPILSTQENYLIQA